MFLSTISHHILSLLLLAASAFSTHSYTTQISLLSGDDNNVRQQCIHLPPGICCRQLNLPGAATRFKTFHSVQFSNMQPRDLALIWTSDRPAPGHEDYIVGNPLPSAAGCGGRVLALKLLKKKADDGVTWFYYTPRDPITRIRPEVITGASYLAMPPQSDTGYDGITGMRAVLGGGGRMFGVKNRTGVAAYPYHMVSRRSDVLEDVGGTEWIWPDQVTVNGTKYAQVGGKQSLIYRSEVGEALNLGPYNLHAARISR